MRKLGVFTALALSGMTASCAETLVGSAIIPSPAPAPRAEAKPRSNNVEAKRQAPQPQVSQQPQEIPIRHEPPAVATFPPPPEPADPNFPVAALIPPPPEPAEPTFPSAPPAVESEPPISTLPEVSPEAAMPPLPEPAEPSFPVVALMPPPPEPAEPSLPSQEEIATEGSVPIPFPDLPSYLSLHPRVDWVDTVGSIEVPPRPLSDAPEPSPERQIPSLIRNPWPVPIDAP
jgi:hypothetical protein